MACSTSSTDESENMSSDNTSESKSDNAELARLNSAITESPDKDELYNERANELIRLKKFPEARQDIEKALSMDSTRASYYLTYADISFAQGKIYDARQALVKAVQLDPGNVKPKIKLAEIYLIVKEHKESVILLNEVLQTDKLNLTALFMRGMNYKEVGDTTKAVSDFQKIVEIDPDYYNAHMQLGVIMQAQNNPAAVGFFDNALKVDPKSEEALYGRGLWYQDHDELNKAIQDYTSIIAINPMNKNAHFNLGYIHQIYLKTFPEAVKHYSNALKADAQYSQAYYNRGLCYEQMGDVQAAADDYKAAVTLKPDYTVAEAGLKRVTN